MIVAGLDEARGCPGASFVTVGRRSGEDMVGTVGLSAGEAKGEPDDLSWLEGMRVLCSTLT